MCSYMNNPIPIPSALEDIAAKLGTQIKQLRIKSAISKSDLNKRTGIAKETLASIEKGSLSVTLAKYLHVLYILNAEKDILLIAKPDKSAKNASVLAARKRSSKKKC